MAGNKGGIMNDMVVRSRRGRSGGGAARRAERTSGDFATAPTIQRAIPNMELLSEETLQIIEANAEQVLEEIGVNFVENPGALERWRAAGADVQGERVHIPKGLARSLCQTAPSTFRQRARNPERSVEIGGKSLVLATRLIAAVQRSRLRRTGDVSDQGDRITRAVDVLMSGV